MKKENNLLRKKGFLVLAIVSCIILTSLASCQTSSINTPSNESQSVSFGTSENASSATESNHASQDTQADPEKLRAMAAGEINVDLTGGDWNTKLQPLAKWFYVNILEKDDSDITGRYTTFRLIAEYNGSRFEFVSYKLDNTQDTQYLSILIGSKVDTKQYTLIDGKLSDTDQYYPLKDSWDKVKNHAVFGSLVGEFPETVCSEGVKEMDVAALIGKNRTVHNSTKVDKNVVAVLNSASITLENGKMKFFDWKIDYIDLQTGSVIHHKIKDLDDNDDIRVYFKDDPVNNGYIELTIFVSKSDVIDHALEYKAKLNTDSTNEDKYRKYTEEESQKLYSVIIRSESGRYETLYKNNDLYLHDHVTGKDVLIFDSNYSEDLEDSKSIETAYPAFFSGDTLYFNIIGYERSIGNGSYNPETNELKTYRNGIAASLYCNRYIYGTKHMDDVKLFRFHINSPENVETLIDSLEYDSFNIYEQDYIYHFIKSSPFEDYKRNNNVTVYSASEFKKVKSYDLILPFSWISNGVVLDDYIFVSVDSAVYDNKAYVLSLN